MLIATLAMVATLPARSVGIGLVSGSLIEDFEITELDFATYNLWATIIGASLVILAGPALDKFGIRFPSGLILGLFGVVVLWFAALPGPALLLWVLILVRGLGQTCLSLAAITILGKSFGKRRSIAMGVFSALTAIFFAAAIVTVQALLEDGNWNWRDAYFLLGFFAISVGVLTILFLKEPLHQTDSSPKAEFEDEDANAISFVTALKTPALWILTMGVAVYAFSFNGITLLGERFVASLGFEKEAASSANGTALAILMGTGILGNLLCGWLSQRLAIMKIFGLSMTLMAGCLALFLIIENSSELLSLAYAILGIAGGALSVVFFTGFAQIFGKMHLGRIQGVAQVASVLASATGPWVFAMIANRQGSGGSYELAFYILAPAALAVAVLAFFARPDKRSAS